MTLKKQNPWKIFSIALLGIVAIGLLAPVDATHKEGHEPGGGGGGLEASDVNCTTPCIDEIELIFDTATQAELDVLDGTVLGLIADLATETTSRTNGDAALQSNIDAIVEPSDWNIYHGTLDNPAPTINPGQTGLSVARCNDFNDIAISGSYQIIGGEKTFATSDVLLQPFYHLGGGSQEGIHIVTVTNTHETLSSQLMVDIECLDVPGTGIP